MFNFGFSNNKRTLSKGGLLFLVKPPNMIDSIGESTYLIDRSGNENNITVFGYCPTFDGSAGQYISGSQILGNETIEDFGGTAETLTVAAGRVTPSAGTVEWFEFADGRKYILQSSKTANQNRFWNINGSYLDSVVLIGLTSPMCLSKSSTPLLLEGYSLEENLVGTYNVGHDSEPNNITRVRAAEGVVFQVGSGVFSDYLGEVVFGNNSALRYVQTSAINDAEKLYFTFDIVMDDGLAPVTAYNGYNNPAYDFGITMKGDSSNINSIYESIVNLGGKYRITFSRTGKGINERVGVIMNTSNTGRTFKISRFHAYKNPLAKYLRTFYQGTILPYNHGIFESFIPLDIRSDFTGTIVCIGDSLTATDYPLDLALIFPHATIIDAGQAGDTPAGMLARFQTAVLDHNPDYICYFGCINAVIGDLSTSTIMTAINGMITMAGDIPMVIGTGTPFGKNSFWNASRQAVLEEINASILAINATNVIAKLDLYTPLLAAGSSVNLITSAGNGVDGLHLSRVGNTTIARLFYSGLNLSSAALSAKNLLGADLDPDLIAFNAPAALEVTDVDNRWFAADHSANDVDPTTIPANSGDKIFKGPSGLLMYSTALTGSNITKAENYVD